MDDGWHGVRMAKPITMTPAQGNGHSDDLKKSRKGSEEESPAVRPDPAQSPKPGGQDLPQPRPLPPGDDIDRAALLGATRNAASQGKIAESINLYEKYLARYAADLTARSEYAGVLAQAARYADAAEQYRRVLEKNPESIPALTGLSDALPGQRKNKDAIEQLRRALDLRKGDPEVAARLTRVFLAEGRVKLAQQTFEQYLAPLMPGDPKVPTQIGSLLVDLDRPQEAMPYLQALREKKPEDVEVLSGLIRASARLGAREQAAMLVAELAGRDTTRMQSRILLAESLYADQVFELARLVYGQVLAGEPGNK